MTHRITLIRKGFREWLEGKTGDEVVGQRLDAQDCPVANYLRSMGATDPGVCQDYYTADHEHDIRPPPWAISFIDAIDMLATKEITARQALAVLDGKAP